MSVNYRTQQKRKPFATAGPLSSVISVTGAYMVAGNTPRSQEREQTGTAGTAPSLAVKWARKKTHSLFQGSVAITLSGWDAAVIAKLFILSPSPMTHFLKVRLYDYNPSETWQQRLRYIKIQIFIILAVLRRSVYLRAVPISTASNFEKTSQRLFDRPWNRIQDLSRR